MAAGGDPQALTGLRGWRRRSDELRRELEAIAEPALRWRLLAAAAALVEPLATRDDYLACDTSPAGDTFMGLAAPPPADVVADAVARARAARRALRELDGALPDQPLAVTVAPGRPGELAGSALEVAAFVVGTTRLVARLDEPRLPAILAAVLAGGAPPPAVAGVPFVCVSLGDDALATARHGHRRAWTGAGGPWLGLGRAGGLATVSTCHLVVDGYGHALLTRRIAELAALDGPGGAGAVAGGAGGGPAPWLAAPPPAPVAGGLPLAVAWRPLPARRPRLVALAHALGVLLHRRAGRPAARFSPTFQVPVARGALDDPERRRRRIVSTTLSVRFSDGAPEPLAAFEARAREVFAREAAGRGLASRLLAAARAAPAPAAWKRRSIGAARPGALGPVAELIGGRAQLSRIVVDGPAPALCAVSSPAQLASPRDPRGGCVITVVDDGARGAITACGTGLVGTPAAAEALLDELLAAATG